MTQALLRSPLDECLTALAWRRLDYAGPVYQLGHGSEAARLESIAVLGGGVRYRFDAPCFAIPAAADHLAANSILAGPIKLVEDAGGGIACVVDLPAATVSVATEFDFVAAESPLTSWAECITAVSSGQPLTAGEAIDPAQITKSLEAAGYTASLDGSGVKTTLVLPGRFAEVAIEPDQPCGLKLSFGLTSGGQSPESAAAARHVAVEVNRRLILAHVSEAAPGVLTAEVRLTMARVHEAWLLAAMESLSVAAELALRPLAALRNPVLAARLLSLNERG